MTTSHRLSSYTRNAVALAALAALGAAHAQSAAQPETAQATSQTEVAPERIEITAKRERRVSKGATNLPLTIKETPQSISTIDRQTLRDFGVSGSNDALRLGTGLTVDEWETNRTNYSARGFDVMLTQVDGLGMTNEWGLVEGQQDTYLFESIELVRGANGLLTGVGNASGTINYIRKRPTNKDGGELIATAGSNGLGHGTHFRVRIGSAQFAGLPRVKRHRLVYDALQDFIDQGLHALAIEIVDPPSSGAGQSHNRP